MQEVGLAVGFAVELEVAADVEEDRAVEVLVAVVVG